MKMNKDLIGATADWHFCDWHLGVRRRSEDYTTAALSALTELEKAGCREILHGGDMLHDKRPTSGNIKTVLQIDQFLIDHGMILYAIDGDHDHTTPSWLSTVLPERKGNEPGIHDVNRKLFKLDNGLTVFGLPPCSAEEVIARMLWVVDEKAPDIVLWHGAIREFCGFPNPTAVSVSELPIDRLKALICGDLHQRRFVTKENCLIGYPGATELRGRDETLQQRTVSVIDTSKAPFTETSIPIKHRKAWAFQIKSVEQLDEVVKTIRNMPADPWPMIFCRYDADIPNVKARLYAALPTEDAILRAKPAPRFDFQRMNRQKGLERENKGLVDFVPDFFPEGGELSDLAILLCDPNAEVRNLLEDYKTKQLA